ncbi:MAG: chromosomal replication initiator protein DnaA [Candidatus Moranbacteria bacterium]|nr:chromosomal replication initiator protein DnaA [Candidatus Moranbacteria bacterium]
MKDLKEKWSKVQEILKENLQDISYDTWFAPLTPLRTDAKAGKIYIDPYASMNQNILTGRYMSLLEGTIKEVFGKEYKVVFEYIKDRAGGNVSYGGTGEEFDGEFYFNPRYNFSTFVVGSNNKYAHAAALAVATLPSDDYNPLFVYGGSGLGKTHLMHAIGHHILQNHPKLKPLYVSSEMFTNEMIKAISEKKTGEFRNKYRKIDVLLIDDIQFLEGKEGTQEEFFYTFEALYQSNKQIIISSDRPPNKLTNFDERLRGRFQWNVVADISPPDYETRVAILRKKAELEGLVIDEALQDVIELICEKVKFNIRELEGAFTRIVTFSNLMNEPISRKLAREVLKDILLAADFNITPDSIKKAVCKHYSIKLSEMESSKRTKALAFPRQIAMYLCRDLTDLSLPKIGENFGNRDHTTVLYACDKIHEEMQKDEELKESVFFLKNIINGKQ